MESQQGVSFLVDGWSLQFKRGIRKMWRHQRISSYHIEPPAVSIESRDPSDRLKIIYVNRK